MRTKLLAAMFKAQALDPRFELKSTEKDGFWTEAQYIYPQISRILRGRTPRAIVVALSSILVVSARRAEMDFDSLVAMIRRLWDVLDEDPPPPEETKGDPS